jgi:hypothetical protein
MSGGGDSSASMQAPPGAPEGGTAVAAGAGGMSTGDQSPQVRPFDAHKMDKAVTAAPRRSVRAVPVRRVISVVVRESQLGILSDDARPSDPNFTGKTIPLEGSTVGAVDDFVKAVQQHVEGWGIAGDGLYWKPVVELYVGPDGQRRAEDLTRLFKNSDIELRVGAAANAPTQGKLQ